APGVHARARGARGPWAGGPLVGGGGPAFDGGDESFQAITGGQPDFTDPRFAAALERMVALRPYLAQNYMGVGYTDMQSMFAFEQAGMFIAGSYELGILKQLNPLLRVGAFPVPGDAPGEGRISYYVDGSYGINAASPNQEAAL